MGATVTDKKCTFNGSDYGRNYIVGWASEQDPYDYHVTNYYYNTRFTILTDASGGNSITISGISWSRLYNNRNHIIINQDPDAYLSGNTSSGTEIPKNATSVTISMSFMPNTTYYVWFVNNSTYSDLTNLNSAAVTVDGSYGTAGTPSASNGNFGRAIPISISGHSSSATFVMSVTCAGNTETLLNNSSSTSVNWTPSVATYAPLITNASSATATITVDTYYGSSKLYTRSTQITVSWAAGTIPPTVSSGWASAAPLNEGSASGLTVWIQKYSKARVTFTPSKVTLQYGATISSFKVKLGSTTYTASSNRADTGIITTTTASLVCTVTDSRGQTASQTLSITLNAYANPALSSISIFRCTSSGAANEDGAYISVKATATISSLGGQNTQTLRVQTRVPGGSWSSATAMTSGTAKVISGFSPDNSYEVRITLTDRLSNSATITQTLPTRSWAMKFRPTGNGVAFGKAAERNNALELGNGWVLVLHGSNGETVTLNYSQLVALLNLL